MRKRWEEYTDELYRKGLNVLDNHDGVIIHLEPSILDCEVKWALGNIIMNKASGDDGIPAVYTGDRKMNLRWRQDHNQPGMVKN